MPTAQIAAMISQQNPQSLYKVGTSAVSQRYTFEIKYTYHQGNVWIFGFLMPYALMALKKSIITLSLKRNAP